MPAETRMPQPSGRHRVGAHGHQVDVLAERAAEEAVPDEATDEVHLDVQGASGCGDRFEDVWSSGDAGITTRTPAVTGARTPAERAGRGAAAESSAATAAASAAPRNTARSSVTIAAVTSRSYAGQLSGDAGQSACGDGNPDAVA